MRYDGRESWRPIHTAVRHYNLECLRTLLNAGAKVDNRATNKGQSEYGDGSNDDQTALHIACRLKNREKRESELISNSTVEDMVLLLLKHGADVNAIAKRLDLVKQEVTSSIRDPRDSGYESGITQVNVLETPLHITIRSGNTKLVSILVINGANLLIPWRYGDTETYPFELCKTDEMHKAISVEWTPEKNIYYPIKIKSEIFMLLLIAKKQNWPLPKEILFYIFKYIASYRLPPLSPSPSPPPQQEINFSDDD